MVSQHIGKPFVLHHTHRVLLRWVIPGRCLKTYAQSLLNDEVLKCVRESNSIGQGREGGNNGGALQPPVDKHLLWVRQNVGGRGLGQLLHSGWTSFNSDASNLTSGSAASASSVDWLLHNRQVDPEQVLINLGFGGSVQHSDNMYARVPERFLRSHEADGGQEDEDGSLEKSFGERSSPRVPSAWSQNRSMSTSLLSLRVLSTLHPGPSLPVFHPVMGQGSVPSINGSPPSLTPPGHPRSVLHPDNQRALALQGFYGEHLPEGVEPIHLVRVVKENQKEAANVAPAEEEDDGNQKNANDRRRQFHKTRSKRQHSLVESNENEDTAQCWDSLVKSQNYSTATESTDSGDFTAPAPATPEAVFVDRRLSLPPSSGGCPSPVMVDRLANIEDLYLPHRDSPRNLSQQRKNLTDKFMSDLDVDEDLIVSESNSGQSTMGKSGTLTNIHSLNTEPVLSDDNNEQCTIGKSGTLTNIHSLDPESEGDGTGDDSHSDRTGDIRFDPATKRVSIVVAEKDNEQTATSRQKSQQSLSSRVPGDGVDGGGAGLLNIAGITTDRLSDSGSEQTLVEQHSFSSECDSPRLVTRSENASSVSEPESPRFYAGHESPERLTDPENVKPITGFESSQLTANRSQNSVTESDIAVNKTPDSESARSSTGSENVKPLADSEKVKRLNGSEHEQSSVGSRNMTSCSDEKRFVGSENQRPQTCPKSAKPLNDCSKVRPPSGYEKVQPMTASAKPKPSTDPENITPHSDSENIRPQTSHQNVFAKPRSYADNPKFVVGSETVKSPAGKPVCFSSENRLRTVDIQCPKVTVGADQGARSRRQGLDCVLHVYHSVPKTDKSPRDENDNFAPAAVQSEQARTEQGNGRENEEELPRMSSIQSDSGFCDAEIGGDCVAQEMESLKVDNLGSSCDSSITVASAATVLSNDCSKPTSNDSNVFTETAATQTSPNLLQDSVSSRQKQHEVPSTNLTDSVSRQTGTKGQFISVCYVPNLSRKPATTIHADRSAASAFSSPSTLPRSSASPTISRTQISVVLDEHGRPGSAFSSKTVETKNERPLSEELALASQNSSTLSSTPRYPPPAASIPRLALQQATVDLSSVDNDRGGGHDLYLEDRPLTYRTWSRELSPSLSGSERVHAGGPVVEEDVTDSIEGSSEYSCTSASNSISSVSNSEIFESHKLMKLINQPTMFKGRRTQMVHYRPKRHIREWPHLLKKKRLQEETRLVQYAMQKFKTELGIMETSIMTRYQMSYENLTQDEREDVEELQHLWAEVRRHAMETEQLLTSRMKSVSAGNDNFSSLASLSVLQRMIDLLKEQFFQKQVAVTDEEEEEEQEQEEVEEWEWRKQRRDMYQRQYFQPRFPAGSWSNMLRTPKLRGHYSSSTSHIPRAVAASDTTTHEQFRNSLLSEVRQEMRSSLQTLHKDLLERDNEIHRLQLRLMLEQFGKRPRSSHSVSRSSTGSLRGRNFASKETEI